MASLAMIFFRQEYWNGLPSPGQLPDPGVKPRSPALQADSLPAEPQGRLGNEKKVYTIYHAASDF